MQPAAGSVGVALGSAQALVRAFYEHAQLASEARFFGNSGAATRLCGLVPPVLETSLVRTNRCNDVIDVIALVSQPTTVGQVDDGVDVSTDV